MPPKQKLPKLNQFMEKRVRVKLTCGRSVSGVLRGTDQFMSLVLHEAIDETQNANIGVGNEEAKPPLGIIMIRGSAVVDIEAQEL